MPAVKGSVSWGIIHVGVWGPSLGENETDPVVDSESSLAPNFLPYSSLQRHQEIRGRLTLGQHHFNTPHLDLQTGQTRSEIHMSAGLYSGPSFCERALLILPATH